MQYRALGKTGLCVSVLGFGASPLGSVFQPIAEEEGIRAVHAAVARGINFIDVSPYYGNTAAEAVLGKALRTIPRDRYILATKVGRYGQTAQAFDFSAGRVRASVDESLVRLHVDHVDLIQCHDIEFVSLDQIVEETLPALREVVRAGKARRIGVTGLPLKALRHVVEREPVDTVLSYCHYCLNDDALAGEIPLFESRQVGVINASPLSMGLLTEQGPPAWHPAPGAVREACAKAAAHCRARGADLAQLALQWAVRQPRIATTLVGMASEAIVVKNLECLERPLDEELLGEVLAILEPVHNVTWVSGRPENN